MKNNEKIEIPKPKVNVNLEHLSINLVSIDKVKLYVNAVESLPWISAFFFLFLGVLINRIISIGFSLEDPISNILIIVCFSFFILTVRQYCGKRKAWESVEKSKIDLKENN